MPKGAKELTCPAVLLSRLPRTRFQATQGRLGNTQTHVPQRISARDCTAMCRQRTGTHFCGEERGKGVASDTGHVDEEAPRKDPSRRKSGEETSRGR